MQLNRSVPASIRAEIAELDRTRGEQDAIYLFHHPDTLNQTRQGPYKPRDAQAKSSAYVEGFEAKWEMLRINAANAKAVFRIDRQGQRMASTELEAGKKAANTLFWLFTTTDVVRLDPKLPKEATAGTPAYNAGFQNVWKVEQDNYVKLRFGRQSTSAAPGSPKPPTAKAASPAARSSSIPPPRGATGPPAIPRQTRNLSPASQIRYKQRVAGARAANAAAGQPGSGPAGTASSAPAVRIASPARSIERTHPPTSQAMATQLSSQGRANAPSPPASTSPPPSPQPAPTRSLPPTPQLQTALPVRQRQAKGLPISPLALSTASASVGTQPTTASGSPPRKPGTISARASLDSLRGRAGPADPSTPGAANLAQQAKGKAQQQSPGGSSGAPPRGRSEERKEEAEMDALRKAALEKARAQGLRGNPNQR